MAMHGQCMVWSSVIRFLRMVTHLFTFLKNMAGHYQSAKWLSEGECSLGVGVVFHKGIVYRWHAQQCQDGKDELLSFDHISTSWHCCFWVEYHEICSCVFLYPKMLSKKMNTFCHEFFLCNHTFLFGNFAILLPNTLFTRECFLSIFRITSNGSVGLENSKCLK